MAARGPSRGTTVFAAIAAALVTTYFAFLIFAAWVTLQYGVKNTDFGWEVQRLGENLYISGVAPMGPAAGALEPGDRVISLNGEALKTDAALSLSLRSVAGASLYSMKVQRGGKLKDVFLRAGTQNGVSFFRERLPLLGSSLLMFLAGLAMLLNWNSIAARFGFAAAIAGALRMGAWALLPLSGFFRTQEFLPYFVFWLPVPLGLPLAYESVMRFSPRRETGPIFRAVGWVLLGACASILLMILYTQTVPAPVPEGVADVQWDGVNYTKNTPASQVGMPLLLVVMLVATAFWIWELYQTEADGDVRRRLLWLMGTGLFFAVPGVLIEVYQWVDGGNAAVRHSWLLAFALLAYSYLLTADRVTHPVTVVRGVFGALLPRAIFRRFDRKYFPREAKIEERLEAVITAVDTSRSLEALQSALTRGIEYALEPAYLGVNPEASLEDLVELGPKKSGEPFTRREKRLVHRAAVAYQRTEKRIRETPADASLDLLRECPSCGACYGSDTVRCVHDGAVPSVSLPIERLIEGKYFLERRIGRGGMGAVYVAKDRRLGRKIAIKIMLSELFGHQGALKRFEREAQAAARLNHANVVQIYDYGPIGKMGAFLVMEYVEGRSWREELQSNGAIKAGVCIPWIEQLLDGVQAAHSAGIVHRDLKPENLLLAERAIGPMQLKILDFGLAKMQLLSFSREEKISIDASTIGTVGYVPPEQLVGGAVDERSDVYAIGRIVLETITGALPDAGIVGVSGNLYKVLQKCVSPVKEDRYGSIAELRTELLPALETLGSALHK